MGTVNPDKHKQTLAILAKHTVFLFVGYIIGSFIGTPLVGVFVAALVALAWHVYHLILLRKWLQPNSDRPIPYGTGVWPEIFARVQHFRDRSALHKQRSSELAGTWKTLIDSLADASFLLTHSADVIGCNPVAAKLLGTDEAHIIGPITNHLRQPEIVKLLENRDFPNNVITTVARHPEKSFKCKVSVCDKERLLLQLVDISPQVKAMKMRTDFVANASHELRTPVTVLKGYIDTYSEDKTLPTEMHAPLAAMSEQVDRMRTIIADLMSLNVLESSGPASTDRVIDIARVINNAEKQCRLTVDNSISIDVQVSGTTGILGSESDLYSIVSNLLANAIQFTPGNGRILIHWEADENGGSLRVQDNGIGISETDLPRITERFYRTESGRAHFSFGTGLGLAIIKHALARHDATLTVESESSKGSSFICHFPGHRIGSVTH